MVILCSAADFYIMEKIRSGEWVPSLDTGQVYSTRKKGFLTPRKTRGYSMISYVRLSHIIWIAANGAIPYGMQIDHINGDREDDRLCNLRLVSRSENIMLSTATLTYSQAEEIRRKYTEGNSIRKLAKEYSVEKTVIWRVINNKTYTKPIDTSGVSKETRKELLEYYKNGGKIDTARKVFKVQQAVIRQVLEEELSREAKEQEIES
ncbi:MAG TPA: HNH endonuclease [Methanocorpusculum sp.]|jgi:Mor family transcriptional regulator|nr:HNH endonuclease [Methanocorpusculum sp.]HJJ70295.1 HNH endonuclease [Methanocorpusculum sp.]HJJ81184.1 HNH endonuclease [Methanocorpusculum sp.]